MEIKKLEEGKITRPDDYDAALEDAIRDTSLPEDTRCYYRIYQLGSPPDGKALVAACREFPRVPRIYDRMLRFALENDAPVSKEMARLLLESQVPTQPMKAQAQRILGAEVFHVEKAIGKPIDIHFTAVDGRKVDLAAMKGKVVLVSFWANGASSDWDEKKAYEKYHDKGFEIIGINVDEDKEGVLRYVRQHDMPWPQCVDRKGRTNDLAIRYNITGLPTLWLVDQKGLLREVDVTFMELEQKVELLLAGDDDWGIGKPLQLRFSALDGRGVDLAALKDKVVLLTFWSSERWSNGVAKDLLMPVVQQLSTNNPSRIAVVGISYDEKKEDILSCIKQKDLPWPEFFDGRGVFNLFAVRFRLINGTLPQTWLVDKKGILRETGIQSGRRLKEKLAPLLAE